MFTKRSIVIIGAAMFALCLGLFGCSGDDQVVVTKAIDTTDDTDEGVIKETNFFPLEAGYVSTFKVTSSVGQVEYVTYEMGPAVSFKGQSAYQWFSYDANGADTAFIVASVDGIDYYSHPQDNAERILEYPLSVGERWERFADLGTGTNGGGGFGDDLGGDDKTDDPEDYNGGGGGLGKEIPFSGDATMTVKAIQTIEMSEGQVYANAYLVTNAIGDTRENRYWYVDGIGLVKFEIGVQNGQPSSSTGELVAYGSPN